MILLIDNYDSFVFNLARYFQRLGQETHVVRNDAIQPTDVASMHPDAIVLSPGPCGPNEAGESLNIVRAFRDTIPMLGICLGHQTIAAEYGARIERTAPMHGRTSFIEHNRHGLFDGVPSPFEACRYHSLVVDADSLPNEFTTTAWSGDLLMAIAHQTRPIVGVQFHPESILTKFGFELLRNFFDVAELVPTLSPTRVSNDDT